VFLGCLVFNQIISFTTLNKALLACLKISTYLYVISGLSLALFTLHWQLPAEVGVILQIDSQNVQQKTAPEMSHRDLMGSGILLSASTLLRVNIVEDRPWLVVVENGTIQSIFSSRDTATILTLDKVYQVALVVLMVTLFLFMLNISKRNRKSTISRQFTVAITVIILVQFLLPWSFIYQSTVLVQSDFSSSTYLWCYVFINAALLGYLTLISAKLKVYIQQAINRTTLLVGSNEVKIESLIAYASQSGTAAGVAKNIAKQLPKNSRYHIACVSSLQAHQLSEYQQVFLLASTYGDGEPPEQAMSFISSLQKLDQSLSSVKYSVLALGDKQYPKFCAFGHQLAAILQQKGAQALLPVAEINQGHEDSIQLWWQQLTQLLGWHNSTLEKTWQTQQVVRNDCLNPKALARPAHHIRLSAAGCKFSPGDLVEVMPENDEKSLREKINKHHWLPDTMVTLQNKAVPLLTALQQLYWQDESANSPQGLVDKLPRLTARTYSIASCQEQGVVDLLVRKLIKTDNSVGLCSGYLSQLQAHKTVNLSIKSHRHFHAPSINTPLIMIAAGTGLAPFIGFLEQRQCAEKSGKSWLIMGERNKAHDNYFDAALTSFERSGCLDKRQHAWSKSAEASQPKYVADIMATEQKHISHWLLNLNAQLYICGNAATLGVSCDAILTDIFGAEVLANLKKQQQVKYDFY
jgi:sulfite reductase (NADPH) flavoprotein alpha-component